MTEHDLMLPWREDQNSPYCIINRSGDQAAECYAWRDVAPIIKAVNNHDALVKALELQVAAETAHLKCDECEGQEIPELCPKCFPLYDDARLARMKALSAVVGQPGSRS